MADVCVWGGGGGGGASGIHPGIQPYFLRISFLSLTEGSEELQKLFTWKDY